MFHRFVFTQPSSAYSYFNIMLPNSDNEGSDESDGSDLNNHAIIYTPEEILKVGLKRVNYSRRRIKRAKRRRNIERFVGHYGAPPFILAQIFEDLQTTSIPEAFLPPEDANLDHFLMAFHTLKRYPTELEREPIFDIDLSKGRDWVFFVLEKIRALKAVKIGWPDDNFGSDLWAITVDGTHCWVKEPSHPTWSINSAYFSHKYGKAGVCYELGISLSENKLVWLNGPFPAGKSDLHIFKHKGLKELLREKKKRGIADGGYPGYPDLLSTPNALDSKLIKKFKSRALKRHETFNGMTKNFDCLSVRFRHDVDSFALFFEAVCVICQYRIEHDQPLYDILVEGIFD